MNDLHEVNVLYIDTVRKLSEEDLLSEFGLTSEMINTLKEIPLANLDKLTDCTQLLLKPNEAVLWEALKALPQK